MPEYERVVAQAQQIHFERAIAQMDCDQAGAVALVAAEPVLHSYVRLRIQYRHPLDLFVLGVRVAQQEGGSRG